MSLPPLKDLVPQSDVKGGSPKTPTGMPVREYQEYAQASNGTIWKVATSLLAGLLISMTVAYFTALQSKGVSRLEMEDYVSKYSPYSQDQKLLAEHNANQDTKIGQLEGKQERMQERQTRSEEKHLTYESEITEMDRKIKLIADYIESEKNTKR